MTVPVGNVAEEGKTKRLHNSDDQVSLCLFSCAFLHAGIT
jgi:hypothetical protein